MRNLRASGGGRLCHGRRVEDFTAVEVEDADKASILRAWAFEVSQLSEDVDADSPDEEIATIAPGFPVFRVTVCRPASTTPPATTSGIEG